MNVKTRGIFIKRIVKSVITDDVTGKETVQYIKETLPCRVNAAIPFNHKMLH